MILQTVRRIVGGTYDLDIELLHELLASVFFGLKLCRAVFIDRACGLRTEGVIDAEGSGKLEVSPMIQRIPHGIRNGLRPFLKLFITASVSCYEFFRNTVASEGPPFIMVASKPYLGKVPELIVLCYHLRVQMAVVVYDRHLFCAFVV